MDLHEYVDIKIFVVCTWNEHQYICSLYKDLRNDLRNTNPQYLNRGTGSSKPCNYHTLDSII